jgi:hypothetical protein
MADDLAFLAAAVPGFPGYADEVDRRGSDERVRAFLGEALAALRNRLDGALDRPLRDRLDAAIFRCEFVDQRHVGAVERRLIRASEIETLARADRELVESACGLATLDANALGARLDAIATLLDRRSAPFG